MSPMLILGLVLSELNPPRLSGSRWNSLASSTSRKHSLDCRNKLEDEMMKDTDRTHVGPLCLLGPLYIIVEEVGRDERKADVGQHPMELRLPPLTIGLQPLDNSQEDLRNKNTREPCSEDLLHGRLLNLLLFLHFQSVARDEIDELTLADAREFLSIDNLIGV